MANYNKINLRFSNFGLNLSHDPASIPFGKYAELVNSRTDIEGQLTARRGMTTICEPNHSAVVVNGLRKISDTINNFSTYIARSSTFLDVTVDSSSGLVSTTAPSLEWLSTHFANDGITGFSTTFGSLLLNQTALPNQVWCYVGDHTKMVKVSINNGPLPGGIEIRDVGINRPSEALSLAEAAGGSLTALGTYYYRYTLFHAETGVESLFESDPFVSTGVDSSQTLTAGNQTIAVTVPTVSSVDNTQFDKVRIYRKGGTLATWRLVTTEDFTGTTIVYNDDASDLSIASALTIDEVSDKPFSTIDSSGTPVAGQPLPYLFGPVNGYTLACGDPQNPGILYWTNKFNPDSQDPAQYVQVTDANEPLVNGCVYNNQGFIFSTSALYSLILGIGESTWTPYKTACGRGLAANHAFAVGPEIYFLAKDGVYATNGGAERSLTTDDIRPIFYGETVNPAHPPIDWTDTEFHRLEFFDNKLWFEYRATDGLIRNLVYDIVYRRWESYSFRIATIALYSEENSTASALDNTRSRLLMGGGDGRLFQYSGFDDEHGTSTTIPVSIKTGLITLNSPLIHKEWGTLILDCNPKGSDITFTAYTNRGATTAFTNTFTSGGRVRKIFDLGDLFSEDIQFQWSWAASADPPILYGYELLYRKDTIQLDRWTVIHNDHGIHGWQILRSAYITYRSDGTLCFEVEVDDQYTFHYTLPDTGGLKKKVFVPINAVKGKLFTYTLTVDTATYFRLYNDDSEVHVKPWVTTFGYQRANPFQGGDDIDGAQLTGPGLTAGIGGSGPSGSHAPSTLGGSNPLGDAFNFLGAGGAFVTPPPGGSTANNSEGSS